MASPGRGLGGGGGGGDLLNLLTKLGGGEGGMLSLQKTELFLACINCSQFSSKRPSLNKTCRLHAYS